MASDVMNDAVIHRASCHDPQRERVQKRDEIEYDPPHRLRHEELHSTVLLRWEVASNAAGGKWRV